MKHLSYSIFAVILLLLCTNVFAMKCGRKIVDIRDSADKVYELCGEPDYQASWTEEVATTNGEIEQTNERTFSFTEKTKTITVEYQEWTYNFGSHELIRVLTFKNGTLIKVDTASRGY